MGAFRAQDGYVNLAPVATMWTAFCDALEAPHLAAHPDYSHPAKRFENRAKLIAEIEAITQNRSVAHWIAAFDEKRIPCGPVNSLDQTFADPQVRHLGIARDIDWPNTGKGQIIGQPFQMSRAKSEIAAPTPEPGEHTAEILAEFGYSRAQIAEFRAAGAV